VGFSFSFVEHEAKFNGNALLNIRHFDNRRHTGKWFKENSQNLETRALIKTPVGRLLVERYSKRHLAAQFRSAVALRGIFKFSEILGSTSYNISDSELPLELVTAVLTISPETLCVYCTTVLSSCLHPQPRQNPG